MTFGLTEKGFRPKRYADIILEKERRARELMGADVNLSESSPLGIFNRLNAWEEARLWQELEKLYLSYFVSTSEGVSLDRNCSNIGVMRKPASRATGEVTFVGEDGTVIPAGFEMRTSTGISFVTTELATIEGGSVTVPIIAVSPGVEGNVDTGAITEVVSPLAGVTSLSNETPTTGGQNRETDFEYRERYYQSLANPGSSTVSAIEAAILGVEGVIYAQVRENDSIEEKDGIPPKSIAPLVYGGDGQTIAERIKDSKAGGIQCYGTEVYTVLDSRGNEQKIGITRPTEVEIDVLVELETDSLFPVDGVVQVTEAITEYINSLGIGQSIIYTRIISRIHSVPGIIDIPVLIVDGGTENVIIDITEVAIPGNINVTIS